MLTKCGRLGKEGKGREGCSLGIRGGETRVEKGPVPVAPQTTYLVFYLPDREENGKGPQAKGRQGKPTRMSKMVIFLQTVVWKAPQQTWGNQLCPCRLRCPSLLPQALEAQWGRLGLWLSSKFRVVSRFQRGVYSEHHLYTQCRLPACLERTGPGGQSQTAMPQPVQSLSSQHCSTPENRLFP